MRRVVGIVVVMVAGLGLWALWRSQRAGRDERAAVADARARPTGSRALEGATKSAELPSWFGQGNAPARRIAGTVTADGVVVEGATVLLASKLTESGLVAPARTSTDSAGRFDFGAQPAAPYFVVGTSAGRTATILGVDLRDPSVKPEPSQLKLELLPCKDVVFGTVHDSSGGVVAGARVAPADSVSVAMMANPIAGLVSESDAEGRYELCVAAGWLTVRVDAAGYGSLASGVSARGRARLDFSLTPEATVVGRTVRMADGTPVARALVRLVPAESAKRRPANATTMSDAEGRFRLTGVGAGRLTLSAEAEGLATHNGVDVVVQAARTSSEVVLRLRPASRVSGIVLEAGRPLAGARVALRPSSVRGPAERGSVDAVTQSDGRFELTGAPLAKLAVSVENYEVVAPRTLTVTQLAQTDVRIEVAAMSAIRGRVTRNGQPVEGASVTAQGESYRSAKSQGDGRFELLGLSPGNYTVQANSQGEGAFGTTPSVVLKKGESKDGVDIELAFSASIAGQVVEAGGAPVVGAFVHFYELGGNDRGGATTGEGGGFVATSLAGSRSYYAEVRRSSSSQEPLAPADEAGFPKVSVPSASSRVEGIRLVVRVDRLSIAGKVIDGQGAPRADVVVTGARSTGQRGPRFSSWSDPPVATTDTNGAFVLSDLSAGTWALQARADDGSEATVEGREAGQQNVVITLEGGGGIEGTLVNFRQTPDIYVYRGDNVYSPMRPEIDGQTFALRAVPPGNYLVTATTGQDSALATVEVKPGEVTRVALRGRGSSGISGQVTEFTTGDPVAGVSCGASLRSGTKRAPLAPAVSAVTDAQGRFEMADVPAGDVYVTCSGTASYSGGTSALTVDDNVPTTASVVVVKRREGERLGKIGVFFDYTQPSLAQLTGLVKGGSAGQVGARAGDQITAVDGVSVTSLGLAAIIVLIDDRPTGSLVGLTLARGGDTVGVNVTVR